MTKVCLDVYTNALSGFLVSKLPLCLKTTTSVVLSSQYTDPGELGLSDVAVTYGVAGRQLTTTYLWVTLLAYSLVALII